jgi:hypothetical protein
VYCKVINVKKVTSAVFLTFIAILINMGVFDEYGRYFAKPKEIKHGSMYVCKKLF